MGPASLWTAANMRIPLLTVMHNNQAFHQEVMVVQQAALRHGRDATRAHIGTKFVNTPRTLESFIRYVRKPARMPPYVNRVMSDEQLTDVYAFLLSVPPSPDAESIPMLRDLLDSR